MAEVARFERATPEAAVIAGWGSSTQWYRNLEAAPAEEVTLGRHRWAHPEQRFLNEPERVALLESYAREHPLAARELARAFGTSGLHEDEVVGIAKRIRAVAFQPSCGD